MFLGSKTTESEATKYPRLVMGAGLFVVAFFTYSMVTLAIDYFRIPAEAEPLTLQEARMLTEGENRWVELTDGVLDCDSRVFTESISTLLNRNSSTEIFLTSENGQTVVFLRLGGEFTCDDLNSAEITGYLTVMTSPQQQALTNEARLAKYIDANTYLDLCGYCGPENTRFGIIMSGLAVVVGLSFAWSGFQAWRK